MEIVVRAAVVFAFLWLITRSVGRSTLGELSTFELLLYVTMGDLVQQAVTQQDQSVTSAVLAVGTFALLTVVLSWTQWRFPGTRRVIAGPAVVVMQEGKPLGSVMKRHRVSVEDLLIAMREQGIRRTGDVEYAVLEANGKMSFFVYEKTPAGPGGQDGDGEAEGSSGAPDKPTAS